MLSLSLDKEAARRLEANAQDAEYKLLPSGPSNGEAQKKETEREVSILENVYWKEFGLLALVWIAFLALQIFKDQGLDFIGEGLDTLKNMAQDLNEELGRQSPLINEIDTKVDTETSDLKNTNVKLKNTFNQLRSSRNFCVDIILLCIILGIAAYL